MRVVGTLLLVGACATAAPGQDGVVPGLEPAVDLVGGFVEDHAIPGAAFALCVDGRLLAAVGFGESRDGAAATADTLFRVASLSKPMTAVAVLRLCEQRRLDLDTPILELLERHPQRGGREHLDPRFGRVTVRHLLQHRGGWDRARSGDPMFEPLEVRRALGEAGPLQPTHVVQRMLYRPLDFDPGERFAYSNFGYCLLGRAIEVATGEAYEDALRALVFEPLEMPTMRLGATHASAQGEAHYHDPDRAECVWDPQRGVVPAPYGGFCLEILDAGAGWVGSVRDLARFATHWSDLLSGETVSAMAVPSRPDANLRGYGMGWTVYPRDGLVVCEHGGSLPGTYARMVCRGDGLSWVLVTNSRCDGDGRRLVGAVDDALHDWARGVAEWPEGDLGFGASQSPGH